ncbi:YicC family protein [bacterium]|nr:YicC family protein [bacterium]
MLRSMTAFGRGQSLGESEDFLVEIHSVNGRRLEIVINMEGHLTEFHPPLRSLIAGALWRGRVTVFVSRQPSSDRGVGFRVNTELAKELKRAYEELRKNLGYEGEVDFSIIASRSDLIVQGNPAADSEKRWIALKSAADNALDRLIAMKETEGHNLRSAFDNLLNDLEKIVASIEDLAPSALVRYEERLKGRISDAAAGLADNDERILREIAILADKLDISEETTRLRSHIDQFRALMEDLGPCGRTMEFLVQEMNREVNTIGAKSDDLTISKLVVRAKTELEKLREQSQNIE